MKGCEISLNPYKYWGNWHFKCAKNEKTNLI